MAFTDCNRREDPRGTARLVLRVWVQGVAACAASLLQGFLASGEEARARHGDDTHRARAIGALAFAQ